MDARLNVYGMLGLEEGDAHVISNAGGVITDDEIRSLTISQRLLGTREIILIHHTDCGMLTFSDEEVKGQIQEEVGMKPHFSLESFSDLEEDVRQSIRRIRASPFIPHKESVRGFIYEVEKRYRNGEEFALVAWSPHWMNQRYDLRYLEDPEDAFGELNDPASISAIVNEDLPEDDPVATAFMNALILDEEQIGELESAINDAIDPHEGAGRWAEYNPEVWQPWVEAAQDAQQ